MTVIIGMTEKTDTGMIDIGMIVMTGIDVIGFTPGTGITITGETGIGMMIRTVIATASEIITGVVMKIGITGATAVTTATGIATAITKGVTAVVDGTKTPRLEIPTMRAARRGTGRS